MGEFWMIESGEKVPSIGVQFVNESGTADVNSATLLGNGKTILFTVPGAYTPTCHNNHLPGYIAAKDALSGYGFTRIICMAVNDHHVVTSWANSSGALGAIDFIADGNASLAKALGIDKDFSGGGMGTRARRAALIVEDGIVSAIFTENKPGVVTSSGAPAILEYLSKQPA